MGLVKGEFHWSLYALAFLYGGKKWREVTLYCPSCTCGMTSSFCADPKRVAGIPFLVSLLTWSDMRLMVGEITMAVLPSYSGGSV